MTEIQPYDGPTDAAQTPLMLWAQDARQAHAVAQSLATTAFVSKTMQGKTSEITGAILTGAELGMQPMAALRSIDIIGGVPAMRAHALRGLVLAHGHDVWVVEQTDTKVVVAGKRSGSDHEQKSIWTIERASKLGLTGKDNWTKQPAAMLTARATAEVCRLIAADVLLGMPYSIEELADTDGTEAPKRAPVKRKAIAPSPEPELSDADPDPLADVAVPVTVPEPDL